MCYTLQYSKGTLTLSTEDRQQALAWSERQLGKHSSMAFIIETEFDVTESLVEKSGTGMRA
jgi:hypothetical protein